MFRIRLLKYFIGDPYLYDNVLSRNNLKCNYLYNCQSISSVKHAQKAEGTSLTSKLIPSNKEQLKSKNNYSLTEQEFLVRLKHDPDKFGSAQEKEIFDEGDIKEEKYFTEQPNPSQKLRTKQYADIIKALIKQRKIKEAIDVVEVRMLKEDRVKPENYIFNLLLGACGRVGYTKKAFMLYNDMKKRGLTVTGGTYTALFNACANSPWPTTDGLTRATQLHNIMIEKGYEPNDTNYNAMIKAFGRCGDLPMAFTLVDEMCSKHFKIKDDTINFLLQACISDKDAGFRHALLVWRKLIKRKINPSLYTFNLILRCIRECGLGDMEVTQDVINKILADKNNFTVKEKETKLLENCVKQRSSPDIVKVDVEDTSKNAKNILSVSKISSNTSEENTHEMSTEVKEPQFSLSTISTIENITSKNLRPNLMATIPHLGNIISLSEVTKPEERLLLVGGCSGFLKNMKDHNCTPNIKTFTQLLDSIPSTVSAEKDLMLAMTNLNVTPDVDFYNMLIKKRSMRFDYEGAKEVLAMMREIKYRPNLMTYGVLSLGCKTKEEARELINEMKAANYRLNAEILGAMLSQACHHMNVPYVLEIMETCLMENIQPNKMFMEKLVKFKKTCKNFQNYNKLTKSQEKIFSTFRTRYKTWLQEVEVDETEGAHPWQQYRQKTEGGPYKWKDTARFKPRHTSLFKVKTSTKKRY